MISGCMTPKEDVYKRQVLLLEGLDLSEAAEGRYDLVAVPLKIAGADGTPVRAFLMPRTI